MISALDSFARYVPIELVRELLERGEVARIGGTTETLSILFTDIEGFTSLSERLEPEELTSHMAEYFSAMLEVIGEEKGTVDKFIGDAIVAFWGAPARNDRHAQSAVRAVLRASARLDSMNAAWERQGQPPLYTRFGLNTGAAVVGNVGAPERLNYTVLGDAINLASRLESLNRFYGARVLAAQSVIDATGGEFEWRHIDRAAVKGKNDAVDIYEPLGETGGVPEERLRLRDAYEAALARYLAGAFDEAARRLEALLEQHPSDRPSRYLLERCREYAAHPPQAWEGFTRHEEK